MLSACLSASGLELDAKTRRSVDAEALRQLAAVQASIEAPFDDPECRRELYALLTACVLTPSAVQQPPVQQALGLLANGLQDPSLDVVMFCRQALSACDLLVHPRQLAVPRSRRLPAVI